MLPSFQRIHVFCEMLHVPFWYNQWAAPWGYKVYISDYENGHDLTAVGNCKSIWPHLHQVTSRRDKVEIKYNVTPEL